MTEITLALAEKIADAALAAGRARKALPLTVVVLDPGGHAVVVKREDGSGILRVEIATGKAWGALGMGLPSRTMGERAQTVPHFFNAIAMASGGRVVPVPGGVLVRGEGGRVVGAVGVSGDTSDMDELCIMDALAQLGLTGDCGK